MGRTFIETTALYESKIKRIERDHLIADIQVEKPYTLKGYRIVDGTKKRATKKFNGIEENVIVYFDGNNCNFSEKVKKLKEEDIIFLKYHIPVGVERNNPNEWQILDILDDIDLLEEENKNVLFGGETIAKDQIIQPRRKETKSKEKKLNKKDIEIANLKEKVVVLEGENAQLKSQLQLLQDKNNMTIEEVQEVIGGDNDGTILL